MSVDFWEGKVKINFNSLGLGGDPFEREAGWVEKYKFPISISNPGTIRNNFRNLIAARVALLAAGFSVFSASFSQKSVYRSRYPLNGNAFLPLLDTSDPSGVIDQCNDPEAAYELRFEHSSFRRWEQSFRGLRDGFVSDSAPQLGTISYGSTAADAAFPAVQTVPITGTPATFTYTLTSGVLSAPVISAGGSGYANGGSPAGTVPLVITDPAGTGTGAAGNATITAGVVTASAITAGGTGYSAGTTITLPLTADPFGLAMYQGRTTYFVNFLAALAAYCVSGHPQRVANAAFPSGFCTQFNNTDPYLGAYPISRIVPQRIVTRQTGQINVTSRGRRKTKI